MPTQTTDTSEEVDTGSEFFVHAKHTCDVCFTRPIVGKRYTSTNHPDFDICSKCFCSYDEDKRGEFAETLLARDKATKNSFFLKLKIVNGGEQDQTRRVNVSELWDSSTTQLSFQLMREMSLKFVLAEMDGDEVENKKLMSSKKIKVTYIDEDGDAVNITSDRELMDAFIQAVKKQPIRPFRITMSYGDQDQNTIGADPSSTPPKRNRPNIAPIIGYARPNRGGRCGRRIAIAEIANKEESMALKSAYKANKENGQAIDDTDAKGIIVPDSVFIHARHTCDVCHKIPIIGNRFHATKIADFDLCEGCFKEYEGDDFGFVPERLARDTQMQGMWLKKQLKKCSVRKELVDILKESREIETSGKKNKPNTSSEKDGWKKTSMPGDQSVKQEVGKPVHDSAKSKETEVSITSPPFFVHARHTCDGCSSTPIIGTRYRATKIPDFDLCQKCFTSYEGEDLDFKPETLDMDCRMQPNWLSKHLASKGFDHIQSSLPCQMFTREGRGVGPVDASQPCQGFSRAKKVDPSQGIAHFINIILEESVKAAKQAKASNASPNARKEADEANEKSGDAMKPNIESAQSVSNDKSSGVNDTVAGAGSEDKKQEDSDEKTPDSPNGKSADESFLSEAEGHGSIAEVIGRTLDVCVQAMEEVLDEEMEQIKNLDKNEVAAIASAVSDTYSVGSSMVSSVTDVLKKMDDTNFSNADVPSVSGATIIESVNDKQAAADENVHVEDASVGSSDDGWSVIGDKKSDQDEFAGAAEMIGSFLYNSGVISCAEKGETNDDDLVGDLAPKEPISPVVLAKWDSELKQLNELGFTDERKNTDVLERLEASHIGCDSSDKVTVHAVVEVLLGGK